MFLVGPRLQFARARLISPYVHALAGGNHLSLDGSGFAFALGGGIDVALRRALAVRLASDYVFNRDVSATFVWPENTYRISAGIVYRFGGSRH